MASLRYILYLWSFLHHVFKQLYCIAWEYSWFLFPKILIHTFLSPLSLRYLLPFLHLQQMTLLSMFLRKWKLSEDNVINTNLPNWSAPSNLPSLLLLYMNSPQSSQRTIPITHLTMSCVLHSEIPLQNVNRKKKSLHISCIIRISLSTKLFWWA